MSNTVTDTNPYAGLGTSATTSGQTASSTLDQNAFLRLMITQLNNQDPTKPLDSAQFMGQLAQFATVSGIQNLQATVEKISASTGPTRALQAANLLGHQVLVSSSSGYLPQGGSLSGAVDVPDGASALKVDVYNAGGELVKSIELGPQEPGLAQFSWAGVDARGRQLPPGQYSLKTQATVAGDNVAPELLVNAQVESVGLAGQGGGIELNLAGLGPVQLTDVRRID